MTFPPTIAPPGASCWVCLEEGPDESNGPAVRCCACRGSAGFAHVSCTSEYAEHKMSETIQRSVDAIQRDGNGGIDMNDACEAWKCCPTCKQEYVGDLSLTIANAFVAHVQKLKLPKEHAVHFNAKLFLADTQLHCGNMDESLSIYMHLIDVLNPNTYHSEPEKQAIHSLAVHYEGHVNKCIANAYEGKNDHLKAFEFLEKVRVDLVKHKGSSGEMKEIERQIENMKCKADLADPAADVKRASKVFDEIEDDLGSSNRKTLRASKELAHALYTNNQYLEAVKVMEKTANDSRRVLGKDHYETTNVQQSLTDLKQDYGRRLKDGALATVKATVFIPEAPNQYQSRLVELREISDVTKDGKYCCLVYEEGQMHKLQLSSKFLILCNGTRVAVQNLKAAQHLNGKLGTIRSYDKEKARYAVEYEDGSSTAKVLVKPYNLHVIIA